MTIHFTADHHFGHPGVIEMCARPFRDLDEMTEEMVRRWNDVVQPGDVVYHLGDFGLGSVDRLKAIFDRLHGEKHLIVGNHDLRRGKVRIRDFGWASVREIAIVEAGGERFCLCHYPMVEWPGYHKGVRHVFGHVHGNTGGRPGSCDVGVDVWGYRPPSAGEVLARIEAPVRDRPADFLQRLPGSTKKMLDRVEQDFPTWGLESVACVAAAAINAEVDSVLAQVVVQGGFRDRDE